MKLKNDKYLSFANALNHFLIQNAMFVLAILTSFLTKQNSHFADVI